MPRDLGREPIFREDRRADMADRSNRYTKDEDRPFDAADEPAFEIASILGQAYLQCVVSGLRFGYKTTKRIIQGEAQLFDRMRASPDALREEALRMIVDEARGCLRDVADAASQEFRRLQSKLDRLHEGTRALVTDPEDAGVNTRYTRRWKAKP
jgi:hypothetical protein